MAGVAQHFDDSWLLESVVIESTWAQTRICRRCANADIFRWCYVIQTVVFFIIFGFDQGYASLNWVCGSGFGNVSWILFTIAGLSQLLTCAFCLYKMFVEKLDDRAVLEFTFGKWLPGAQFLELLVYTIFMCHYLHYGQCAEEAVAARISATMTWSVSLSFLGFFGLAWLIAFLKTVGLFGCCGMDCDDDDDRERLVHRRQRVAINSGRPPSFVQQRDSVFPVRPSLIPPSQPLWKGVTLSYLAQEQL